MSPAPSPDPRAESPSSASSGAPSGRPAPAPTAVDVVVVGGGAAGLAAALVLGRARRRVVVVDAGRTRNACSPSVHGYLTQDGTTPAELVAAGRREVRGYGVEIVEDEVREIARADGGPGPEPAPLVVTTVGGHAFRARRVVLATGIVDELPVIPGLAERWGLDVLHCPYCHGYEVRDRALGVIARDPEGAFHQAVLLRQLSDDVALFLDEVDEAEIGEHESELLRARDVSVVAGKVVELRLDDDGVSAVVLADGRAVPRSAVFVAPRFTVNDAMIGGLGVERVETGMGTALAVDDQGRTDVPGLWAAGNVTDLSAQVLGAADSGARAGIGINGELCLEDAERAWAHAHALAPTA
ncbi:NAD(P)/FAD-dependent oxidoreductase [Georgenia faecalis]|uniref:NAD(P)/FAD-dependent oxidoreductase n=1 Tax=Georgenia faecalis TaxID=2483799 RepID=A0ABV9DCA2_9MICO|nr:NAD(P)/FAD-dependent oxidoreductase [Georgenia faecalis]